MKKALAFSLIFVSSVASAQVRQRSVRRPPLVTGWTAPRCNAVVGLPSMRFLQDAVVAPNVDFSVNRFATSLAVGDVANVLYAVFDDALFESRDAGCNWQALYRSEALRSSKIAGARGGFTYLYSDEVLIRIKGQETAEVRLPERVRTIAVAPRNPLQLRAIAVYGTAYESQDAGDTWTALGDATPYIVNTAAFDPRNFDHIIAGGSNDLSITRDGGQTWSRSNSERSAFEIAFSPVDPRIVWVQSGDSLMRSDDGGASFVRVLQSNAEFSFTRAVLAPDPRNSDVVAISSWDGIGMFDAATNSTTVIRTPGRAGSFAWSPAGVLYFSSADEVIIID